MFEKIMEKNSQVPEAFDGRVLQIIIGLLALTLPFILIISNAVLKSEDCGGAVLSAISAYFHSKVGTYFTGVLFALAMAMFAYKGERVIDKWLANFASLMAILVAIFPTSIDMTMARALNNACLLNISPIPDETFGYIHYGAAILLFVALVGFCYLFKISGPQEGKWKRNKNIFYYFCGLGMIFSMVFMALYIFDFLLSKEWFVENKIPVVLIGESICLVLFGLSWLVRYSSISYVSNNSTAPQT